MIYVNEERASRGTPTKPSYGSDTHSLGEAISRDLQANQSNLKSQLIMTAFRLSHALTRRKHTHRLLWAVGIPIIAMYRVLVQWILCVDMPAETCIGPGLRLYHGQALIINCQARIGRDCTLRHCTTIGSKVLAYEGKGSSPVIGNRVDVGSNAVIIGGVYIGDDAVIGAGSVVIHDVPSRAVVAGNPARLLHYK